MKCVWMELDGLIQRPWPSASVCRPISPRNRVQWPSATSAMQTRTPADVATFACRTVLAPEIETKRGDGHHSSADEEWGEGRRVSRAPDPEQEKKASYSARGDER